MICDSGWWGEIFPRMLTAAKTWVAYPSPCPFQARQEQFGEGVGCLTEGNESRAQGTKVLHLRPGLSSRGFRTRRRST